jgi:hypothetical protein
VLIAGDKKVNATAEWERERGNFFPLSHGETLNEIVKQVVFRLMAPYIYIYIFFLYIFLCLLSILTTLLIHEQQYIAYANAGIPFRPISSKKFGRGISSCSRGLKRRKIHSRWGRRGLDCSP